MNWIYATVKKGNQLGRQIGYPTANLNPQTFPYQDRHGVYACLVRIDSDIFTGALNFGPRMVLDQVEIQLEIHILNFNKEIYGKEIGYKPLNFIRAVKKFNTFEELKTQIGNDIKKVEMLRECHPVQT